MTESPHEKVRLIASAKSWIEGIALSQLRGTANLPGMRQAVGLPDLHPGKNGPVGAAFVADGIVYPHLVGNDVGCGMGLWRSELSSRKLKLDRWENRLTGLDLPWDGDRTQWLEQFELNPGAFDEALGTVGGGNHFAELQTVERIEDAAAFRELGFEDDRLVVLVHSGSRGLGKMVLDQHMQAHGYAGLEDASESALNYLAIHDYAVKWAQANRALIAQRFLAALGSDARKALDLPHNFVSRETVSLGEAWVHRKGANPSNRGALVIPGSRGSRSYLVKPAGNQAENGLSLAHGAGRKWNRTDCRARLRGRFDEASLTRTEIGSRVICEDRDLLYEEAPQAYKKIETVVGDLAEAGLVQVVAVLRPLITYKLRRRMA